MAKRVLMDDFRLTLFAPHNLRAAEFDAIRSTLTNAGFRAALRRAVRQAVCQFPSLDKVRARLSR